MDMHVQFQLDEMKIIFRIFEREIQSPTKKGKCTQWGRLFILLAYRHIFSVYQPPTTWF